MKKAKKPQYHSKGIGGRNKPKNKTPLPINLMKLIDEKDKRYKKKMKQALEDKLFV